MAAELLRVDLDPTPPAIVSLLAANLPQALRAAVFGPEDVQAALLSWAGETLEAVDGV